MKSLIKNDFFKMYKEKAHIILLIIMAGVGLLSIGLMMLAKESLSDIGLIKAGDLASMAYFSAMGGTNLGIFIVLSVSIYLGNDFRTRTINLKILAGHSREKIFFGILIINLIIFSVFFVLNALLCIGLSYLLLDGFGNQLTDVLIKTLLMLPPYLAIVSIATFISLSLKSVLGIVINLVVLFVFGTLGQVFSLLAMAINSDVLIFITQTVPHFVLSNITGGGMIIAAESATETTYKMSEILNNVFGSLVFMGGALTGGYFIFRNKPLA